MILTVWTTQMAPTGEDHAIVKIVAHGQSEELVVEILYNRQYNSNNYVRQRYRTLLFENFCFSKFNLFSREDTCTITMSFNYIMNS